MRYRATIARPEMYGNRLCDGTIRAFAETSFDDA